MAVVMDLEEQEQIAELKAWWKKYGNFVTVLVLVVSVSVLGYRLWDYYQDTQAQKAMLPYETLKEAVYGGDVAKITGAADTLAKEYGKTAYATLGNLEAASALVSLKDVDGAIKRYQWVIDHGIKPEWQLLARINLSQVLIDKQKYDEAIKTLAITPVAGFEAVLASAQGDAYWAADQLDKAREAYKKALTSLDTITPGTISKTSVNEQNAALRMLLETKMAAIGEKE